MPMKTIEIDFDVHRLIELERRGFEEPENQALRRLLKLPDAQVGIGQEHLTVPAVSVPAQAEEGKPWSWKGVTLPHGTELRMDYAGQVVRGKVENGVWMIEGKVYKSPSDAAGSSVLTKDGTRTSLNGWLYWEVKRPADATWRHLQSLKPR